MKTVKNISIIIALALALFCCRSEDILLDDDNLPNNEENIDSTANKTDSTGFSALYPDWTDETHGIMDVPNYDIVFNQNEVLRMDLKIDHANWQIMQNDLATNLNSGSKGPGLQLVEFDPVWVPCSVFFNGIEWYQVGVRYKGNSSLSSSYKMGIDKLSFKLDFDQYEDDYPMIKNQRFYGFKQLSLKNNYDDPSFIREKVASDLFRNFGLASSQTSFCAVYVDYGSGPHYFGLYSIVEQVDDTVIKSQYTDGSGNIYKPDGTAASFASGSFNEDEMGKQNNEELMDYSDVIRLYSAINSSTRTSDFEAWKTELEGIFDVDLFLKWLAANTTMQNWDTYGKMTHNYYLYSNPTSGRIDWIPWDGNEALQDGKQGGALSIALSEVGNNWPLIRYIIDVPEYENKYKDYLQQFVDNVFTVPKMEALYDSYYLLLREYAYAEEPPYSFLRSSAEFDSAIATLKTHVATRVGLAKGYLNE